MEVEQLITVETTIRMMWIDTRARIKEENDDEEEPEVGLNQTNLDGLAQKKAFKPEYVTINPRLAKHFWIPDIFIDQAKQIREPTFHVLPASLRIYRFVSNRPMEVTTREHLAYQGNSDTTEYLKSQFFYEPSKIYPTTFVFFKAT